MIIHENWYDAPFHEFTTRSIVTISLFLKGLLYWLHLFFMPYPIFYESFEEYFSRFTDTKTT